MSYKVYVYAIMILLTSFSFSGINFNNVFKPKHEIEAKIFVMLIILSVSYLVSELLFNFIGW